LFNIIYVVSQFSKVQTTIVEKLWVTRLKKPVCIERRSCEDRRQSHISFSRLVLCKGKRRGLRRADDSKQITVFDKYDPSLMIFTLIVLGLSMVDAVLTLILLGHGAIEVNPVMQYYIGLGPGPFVIAKYSLTAISLVFMVVLSASSFMRFRIGSRMFIISGVAFGAVVMWELHLLETFYRFSTQLVVFVPNILL